LAETWERANERGTTEEDIPAGSGYLPAGHLLAGGCGKDQAADAPGDSATEPAAADSQQTRVTLAPEQITSSRIGYAVVERRAGAGILEATAQIEPAGNRFAQIGSRACTNISVVEVRGLTPGLRPEDYEFSVQLSQAYELIIKLEIVGTDAQVDDWGEVIVKAGRKGKAGDGMVPVDQAVRVRTGERGEAS
jgi:nitrogen regulatory protein PII